MAYLKGIFAGIAMRIAALTFVVLLAVGSIFVRVELAARWRIGNAMGFFGSVPLVPVFARPPTVCGGILARLSAGRQMTGDCARPALSSEP